MSLPKTPCSSFYKKKNLFKWVLVYSLLTFHSCKSDNNAAAKAEDFSGLSELFDKSSKILEGGSIDSAFAFLDSAVADRELSVKANFMVIGFKSGTYYRKQRAEEASFYIDSMFTLLQANDPDKYKAEYALAHYSKGDVLMLQNNFNDAYGYYYKARLIGENAVDSCTLGEFSYRIGMLLYQQLRFTEAAESFKKAFAESESCTINFEKYYRSQEILNNVALSYHNADNNDSALIYCEKALKYIAGYDRRFPVKREFHDIARGVVYGTLGRIYKDKGDYENAKNFFNRSIAINTHNKVESRDAQLMQLQLAEVHYIQQQRDSMKLLLDEVGRSLVSTKHEKAEIEWNRLMWKYYESNRSVTEAHEYLLKYTVLQDSVQKSSRSSKRYDVGQQVKLLEDQYKINSLENENKLKNLYLLIFITTSALALLIGAFFLNYFANTRKNLKLLRNLNNIIEDQNARLEKTLAELEERNKEKDRILRVVAHDLRTPIASIAMLAELLQEENNDVDRKKLLHLIKASSTNSLSLINEILEAAGLINSTQLFKEKTDVNELIKDTVTLLQFQAADKQQTISTVLLDEAHYVYINKEKIVRVITNLITNAIKFSEPGRAITVKAQKVNDSIQIVVQDNGIGIPDNLRNKIFEMFTEAKRVGTVGEKPFGLGLSICKQIVEGHGGKIWVESEPGKGSSFYVELKQATELKQD